MLHKIILYSQRLSKIENKIQIYILTLEKVGTNDMLLKQKPKKEKERCDGNGRYPKIYNFTPSRNNFEPKQYFNKAGM
jgi:hypothetical protein